MYRNLNLIIKIISSLFSQKFLIYTQKLLFLILCNIRIALDLLYEYFLYSPFLVIFFFLIILWFTLHKVCEPYYYNKKYFQIWYNITTPFFCIRYQNWFQNSPGFIGTGAIIVIGSFNLMLDMDICHFGGEHLTDTIAKIIVEVEKTTGYYSLALYDHQTLPDLVTRPYDYTGWSVDLQQLPKFTFKPTYSLGYGNHIVFAMKHQNINNGEILQLGETGLQLNQSEMSNGVSKIIRLMGETKLEGVRVYYNPNGNFGSIKFLEEQQPIDAPYYFDILYSKQMIIENFFKSSNKDMPQSITDLRLVTEPTQTLIQEKGISRSSVQATQFATGSTLSQPVIQTVLTQPTQYALQSPFSQPATGSTLSQPDIKSTLSQAASQSNINPGYFPLSQDTNYPLTYYNTLPQTTQDTNYPLTYYNTLPQTTQNTNYPLTYHNTLPQTRLDTTNTGLSQIPSNNVNQDAVIDPAGRIAEQAMDQYKPRQETTNTGLSQIPSNNVNQDAVDPWTYHNNQNKAKK